MKKREVVEKITEDSREISIIMDNVRESLLEVSRVVGEAAEKVGIVYEDENTWSYENDDVSRLCIRSHKGVWGIYIENSDKDEEWLQSLADVGDFDIVVVSEHILSLLEGYCIALHAEKVELKEKQINVATILEALQ